MEATAATADEKELRRQKTAAHNRSNLHTAAA